jgi:hypothetical protein
VRAHQFRSHLLPGEEFAITLVATSREQAGVALGFIKRFLAASPILPEQVIGETADSLSLAGGCLIEAIPCSARSSRGRLSPSRSPPRLGIYGAWRTESSRPERVRRNSAVPRRYQRVVHAADHLDRETSGTWVRTRSSCSAAGSSRRAIRGGRASMAPSPGSSCPPSLGPETATGRSTTDLVTGRPRRIAARRRWARRPAPPLTVGRAAVARPHRRPPGPRTGPPRARPRAPAAPGSRWGSPR